MFSAAVAEVSRNKYCGSTSNSPVYCEIDIAGTTTDHPAVITAGMAMVRVVSST